MESFGVQQLNPAPLPLQKKDQMSYNIIFFRHLFLVFFTKVARYKSVGIYKTMKSRKTSMIHYNIYLGIYYYNCVLCLEQPAWQEWLCEAILNTNLVFFGNFVSWNFMLRYWLCLTLSIIKTTKIAYGPVKTLSNSYLFLYFNPLQQWKYCFCRLDLAKWVCVKWCTCFCPQEFLRN